MSAITDVTEISEYYEDDEYDDSGTQSETGSGTGSESGTESETGSDSETETEPNDDSHSENINPNNTNNNNINESSPVEPQPQPQPKPINNNNLVKKTLISNTSNTSSASNSIIAMKKNRSRMSILSNDSVDTQVFHGASDEDGLSILSLKEYDEMVENHVEDEHDDEEKSFTTNSSKFHNKSKSVTPDIDILPSLHNGSSNEFGDKLKLHTLHSISISSELIIVQLEYHQIAYINSLFHILYKIITLKKVQTNISKLSLEKSNSYNTSHSQKNSFMELLKRRKDRDRDRDIMTGDVAANLPSNDRMYVSDSEAFRHKNINYARKPKREQNRLLESFCASLSFKNLFKLLKSYQLSTNNNNKNITFNNDEWKANEEEDDEFGLNNLSDNNEDDSAMICVEMLGCKILRKIVSYSDVIMNQLLNDNELDLLSILISLLYNNSDNIDLVIYVLNIFEKITKNNEDTRELFLEPLHFDAFLRSLDKWLLIFINSSQKLSNEQIKQIQIQKEEKEEKEKNNETKHNFMHLDLLHSHGAPGLERMASAESLNLNTRTKSMIDAECNIEVTVAMLKFFNQLCTTNALDMVENRVNDRILIVLDYYLKVSRKSDLDYKAVINDYEHENDIIQDEFQDDDHHLMFIFNDTTHQACFSLCLDCISSLATDINMLLEFVYNGTVEKLSRICWSFRDNSDMIKKICMVLNKLLKLEQGCQELVKQDQNVINPLVEVVKYLFYKTYIINISSNNKPILYIVGALFPMNKYLADAESIQLSSSLIIPPTHDGSNSSSEEEDDVYDPTHSLNNSNIEQKLGKKVRFHKNKADHIQSHSVSYSGTMGSMLRSSSNNIHNNLRDIKDILNVFINLLCIDSLCLDICNSDLILLLMECISNKTLQIHKHMMMSLILSDLIQRLTSNKVAAKKLLESKKLSITKHIVDAVQNNANNRGVVLKYLRSLQNLKKINAKILKNQLKSNKSIDFLNNFGVDLSNQSYQTKEIINEILKDDE